VKKIFIFLFVALLLAGIVSAEEGKPMLTARFDNINCHAQFAISYAQKIAGLDANLAIALNEKITTLNGSLAVLAGEGKQAMTGKEFNPQSQTVWSDIKALNQETRNALKNFKGAANRENRVQLKQKHSEAKQFFVDCKQAAEKSFAQAKIAEINGQITSLESKLSKLKAKGVDTAGIESIISEAKATVINQISAAIAEGDYNKIKGAIKNNCLFNGCSKANFHLEAKIEIAKLDALLAKIKDKATEAGLTAEWQSAQGNVDAAKAALESVGTAKYAEETRKAVWDNIREAADKIKALLKTKKQNNATGGNAQ